MKNINSERERDRQKEGEIDRKRGRERGAIDGVMPGWRNVDTKRPQKGDTESNKTNRRPDR